MPAWKVKLPLHGVMTVEVEDAESAEQAIQQALELYEQERSDAGVYRMFPVVESEVTAALDDGEDDCE